MNHIFQSNLDKDNQTLTKMIKDALRMMRFNNNRGYYFIFDMYGNNILQPILPRFENTNLLNYKDNNYG